MNNRSLLISAISLLLALALILGQARAGAVTQTKMVPVGLTLTPQAYLPYVGNSVDVIYASWNLSGHQVFAECNPGGGSQCPCSPEDVHIEAFADRGRVTSNVRQRHTYVNAIGYRKFTEFFPDEGPITLGRYIYTGEFRLPSLPHPDLNQLENPQAIHLMIQFWDGRDALGTSNKTTTEGTIYWQLNPWELDYGKIKVYASPLQLIDTGMSLAPDTEWHSFELAVDLVSRNYLYIAVDDQRVDLSEVDLARVHHPEWGEDVSLSITTESLATWPQYECQHVFSWTTDFRNLAFALLPTP